MELGRLIDACSACKCKFASFEKDTTPNSPLGTFRSIDNGRHLCLVLQYNRLAIIQVRMPLVLANMLKLENVAHKIAHSQDGDGDGDGDSSQFSSCKKTATS